MNMNRYHANASKCVSIWYNYGNGYHVAMCDEPWVGFRGKWFKLQRDAITYAKLNFPGVRLWREIPSGGYIKVK